MLKFKILLLITSVLLVFSCMKETKEDFVKEQVAFTCDGIKSYKIPKEEALSFIENYKKMISGDLEKKVNIKNKNVTYFQLPKCELKQIISEMGEGCNVKGHLALNDDSLITLIFEVTKPNTNNLRNPDDETLFFDFINPCPPMCDQ